MATLNKLMAFKFPSSNWQEPAGFDRADGECVACKSTHDLGRKPHSDDPDSDTLHVVCRLHSKCTDNAIMMIVRCRFANPEHLKQISVEEFEAGRWNSYDRDAMVPYMCQDLIIQNLEYTLTNCSRYDPPAGTYDDALQLYAHELVKRLKPVKETDDAQMFTG